MSDAHATFAEWDAAYVLGVLPPADRLAFESHLATCDRCSAAVADLAAMPGLLTLAGAPPEGDVAEAEPDAPSAPVDLVDRMLRSERRRRLRHRLVVLGAAAAVVAAIAIVVVPPLVDRAAPQESVALEATSDTAMTVDVGLDPVAWGTRIEITCDYPEGGTWGDEDGLWTYGLVVASTDGTSEQVATWTAVDGREVTFDAASGIPLDEIASVEVVSASGVVLLAGTPE